MQKPQISRYKKKIEQFCKRHHISSLALFGSILTSSFGKSSDIDFLVQFDNKYIPTLFALIGMESELSDIIGHKVDLRTPKELSSLFRDSVIAQAKIIYEQS